MYLCSAFYHETVLKMSLTTLVINIGIVALILTLGIGFGWKKHKSWPMTFLQNFTGVLFVFSGWVKAIDPMGTAYKMEQYFAEFENLFSGTFLSFVAPLFPTLSEYSIAFSVSMIIFEIVLGIALLLGSNGKVTSWLFLLLVAFFTVLTGFTYLTGYVPQGVHFFDFANWEAYKATNMKVTDCGCFGDFIKLEPKVSFFKDVVLMIPALYFVFKHKDMHQLWTPKIRTNILSASTIVLFIYCINNFIWNEPHIDFRPFKIGTDVASIKNAEDEAAANVQIIAWKLKNKEKGNIIELPNDIYMKQFMEYPKDKWEVLEQIQSEPAIKRTKISDFQITDLEGNDYSDVYLANEKYHFMILTPKLKFTTETNEIIVQDSIFAVDTVIVEGKTEPIIVRNFTGMSSETVEEKDYIWPKAWLEDYKTNMQALIDGATNDGHEVSIVFGGATKEMVEDFKKETGIDVTFYTADDILLKTIIRSNPGIVLWKNGKIVHKWHKNRLPSFDKIKAEFLK